jgi:hypothetical protein
MNGHNFQYTILFTVAALGITGTALTLAAGAASAQDQTDTTETHKKQTGKKGKKGTEAKDTTSTSATTAKETTAPTRTTTSQGTQKGAGTPAGNVTGTITASPNPCHIAAGKVDCTTYLTWSSTGPHARVYVSSTGKDNSGEREFATGHARDKVSATWIGAGTTYTFTLIDWSSGSRGRNLASVTVTAAK